MAIKRLSILCALLLALTTFVGQVASAFELDPQARNAGFKVTFQLPALHEFQARTILTPSEFAPASELQMTAETFRRMARALVGTVERTADIVVLVRSQYEASRIVSEYAAMGGDTNRLQTYVIPYNSFWYQDYGPIYAFDDGGALVSNDFIYSRYNRYYDDAVPAALAKNQNVANRQVSMNFEGGNFISDGRGTCFASTRMYEQNPQLSVEQVNALMLANLGCQRMVTLAPLIDDITFHIDLYAKLVNDDTFVVGDFIDHPANKALMDKNAQFLRDLGYNVVRMPVRSRGRGNFLSHINSFFINGYALVPAYGIAEDQVAEEIYTSLGYKVLMINARDLSGTGGAIHCILRSKPAY